MTPRDTDTLLIGASISGLATAACLKRRAMQYTIIEKEAVIAAPWRNHYERLHLHTSKRFSNLPFKKFGRAIPKYPSRQQVIDYLEDYRAAFGIEPVFHTAALSVEPAGDRWITRTNNGDFRSKYVVMATGAYGRPKPVGFRGMETFPGPILHSYGYKTGSDFKGKRVLVVGFGNSACEIAIDLCEQGASAGMSVRSPVNVVPRDVLGIPVLQLSLLLSRLSPRVADAISAPLMRVLVGDLTRLGLKRMPYGPLEEIRRDGNAPVLDIGTIKLIRNGSIRIYGDIDRIERKTVYFADGRSAVFDAIIAGIGYFRDYAEIVKVGPERFEDLRVGVDRQKHFGRDGLYFCGYWISPTGQIRENALDAQKIAADIARTADFSNIRP